VAQSRLNSCSYIIQYLKYSKKVFQKDGAPAGSRTQIFGSGDQCAIHCTTGAKLLKFQRLEQNLLKDSIDAHQASFVNSKVEIV
jgi:hypothetical protein